MPQGHLKSIRPGVYRGPADDLPPDQWKIGYELIYLDGEKAFHLFDLSTTSQLADALTGLVTLVKRELLAYQEKDLALKTEKRLGYPVDKVGLSEQVNVQLKSADNDKPSDGISIGG